MQPVETQTGTPPAPNPGFARYVFLEWLRPVGEAILLAFLVTTFFFTTVGVVGNSDQPTLQSGQRLLIPKLETWLYRFGLGGFRRGDLVVVRPNASSPYATQPLPFFGQWGATFRPFFIKRVVGLPGDRLRMERGQLYLNGQPVNEAHTVPYWRHLNQLDETSDRANSDGWPFRGSQTGEYTVPPNHYFVMGDNRSPGGSEDSRGFGPIPLSQIGGKATFVLWPPVQDGRLAWRVVGTPEAFR